MVKTFIDDSFLLHNGFALSLYHEYARKVPVYDYHCHLPAEYIAENRQFRNVTEAWLYQDHYKWRAMRANGIDERFITGPGTDLEKFKAWAVTVPYTIRNPLYHWTHMELKTFFGVDDKLLGPENADDIYAACSARLQTDELRVRSILKKMRVRVVCTTDDPVDELEHHKTIASDTSIDIRVVPSFRPDRALQIETPVRFNDWVEKLGEITGLCVDSYPSFIEAISKRHDYFHENGCRISDHGLEYPFCVEHTRDEVCKIFNKARSGKEIAAEDARIFKSAVMNECVRMDSEKGWAMQLHLGVLRNTNTRFMNMIGPDSGFDSMGDFNISVPLVRFLDQFDKKKSLPRTVLYNINPRDNESVASIIGSFQEGPVPGKIQLGPGWWFNDTKDGMLKQMNTLSNLGLLSRFIGMTTDSRSFFSFVRHDYFRRILCSMIGEDVERGELPGDIQILGKTARDICYNNAEYYFGIC